MEWYKDKDIQEAVTNIIQFKSITDAGNRDFESWHDSSKILMKVLDYTAKNIDFNDLDEKDREIIIILGKELIPSMQSVFNAVHEFNIAAVELDYIVFGDNK